MELNNHQFLWLPTLVWKFLNKAAVDLVLLAALEQFEYQATDRVLLAALEKYENSGTAPKDVKTPAKMLPRTPNKHFMCTISNLMTMASKFEIRKFAKQI